MENIFTRGKRKVQDKVFPKEKKKIVTPHLVLKTVKKNAPTSVESLAPSRA